MGIRIWLITVLTSSLAYTSLAAPYSSDPLGLPSMTSPPFASVSYTPETIGSARDVYPNDGRAPYFKPEGDIIEGYHIVLFQSGQNLEQHIETIGVDLPAVCEDLFVSMPNLPGYRACMNETLVHDIVRKDPKVQHVEHEIFIQHHEPINRTQPSMDLEMLADPRALKRRWGAIELQDLADWNLALVSRNRKRPTSFPVQGGTYRYPKDAATGVDAYVVNGGVRISHNDIKDFAVHFDSGIDVELSKDRHGRPDGTGPYTKYCKGEKRPRSHMVMDDLKGHGTHVAGILGGRRFGVAKGVTIVNVKVLCGVGNLPTQGSLTGNLVQAFSDILATHVSKKGNPAAFPNFKGSIINISAGMRQLSPVMHWTMNELYTAGIPVVAAADNDNVEENEWQCQQRGVKCVGAMNELYMKVNPSAFGVNVAFTAPGHQIRSLGIQSDTALDALTGSSMATPHITGLGAQVIGENRITSDVENVWTRLHKACVPMVVEGYGNNPRKIPRLINNGVTE